MPLISVIVPNYNHASYLPQRLDSIFKQTFQDFEVIILDDFSTDNSQEIIKGYRNNAKVAHILINDRNSGNTFKQWQKGIDVASGNYIWIAESDDCCEPTFLQELVAPLLSDALIALSYCQSILLTPSQKILYPTRAEFLKEIIEGNSFIEKYMLGVNHIINASAVVFRKDLVSAIPLSYMEMKYCGDWLFWVHMCLNRKVYISGKYLNYYLRHEGSVAPIAVSKGLDFLEGNKVFKSIMEMISVSHENKMKGLEIRRDMYIERKKLFINEEIQAQVFDSMTRLDPLMNSLILNRENELRNSRIGIVRKLLKKLLNQ